MSCTSPTSVSLLVLQQRGTTRHGGSVADMSRRKRPRTSHLTSPDPTLPASAVVAEALYESVVADAATPVTPPPPDVSQLVAAELKSVQQTLSEVIYVAALPSRTMLCVRLLWRMTDLAVKLFLADRTSKVSVYVICHFLLCFALN